MLTVSKLRKILKEETDLYKFTDDERSYENLIDYAIDEVLKGVKNWLHQNKHLQVNIWEDMGNNRKRAIKNKFIDEVLLEGLK